MEISESAWAKAKEMANDWAADDENSLATGIARAIMQERQECAELAYDYEGDFRTCRDISKAIRNK